MSLYPLIHNHLLGKLRLISQNSSVVSIAKQELILGLIHDFAT